MLTEHCRRVDIDFLSHRRGTSLISILLLSVLRFVEYKEAVHQIGEDFSKVKDSAWNRQRIMKFFLDPMIDAIEPNLEDFNYFKSYLKRGLRS